MEHAAQVKRQSVWWDSLEKKISFARKFLITWNRASLELGKYASPLPKNSNPGGSGFQRGFNVVLRLHSFRNFPEKNVHSNSKYIKKWTNHLCK